jgi:hypothetical protein
MHRNCSPVFSFSKASHQSAFILATLVLFFCLRAPTTLAQIRTCAGSFSPDTYRVHLDEPSIEDATTNGRTLLESMWRLLRADIETPWNPSEQSEIALVACRDRTPSIDGRDFDAALIHQLYAAKVLLEVWFHLQKEEELGKITADVGYLVVSFSHDPAAKEDSRAIILHASRDYITMSWEDALYGFFKQSRDLEVLVSAAIGLRLARVHEYEAAQVRLCYAADRLERGLGDLDSWKVTALRDKILVQAGENIRTARADGRYRGGLRLLTASNPCPGSR